MARTANSRFQRGRGVFKCVVCGRSTRDAGDNSNSECCPECYELAGLQNSVYDGEPVAELAEWRDHLLAKAISRGSNADAIRSEFNELFPAE